MDFGEDPSSPCVRCGYCCKIRECAFGEWDDKKNQCKYLLGNEPGEYACAKYEELVNNPFAKWNPAFGAGCCAPLFNSHRAKVLQKLADKSDNGGES